MFEVHLTVHNGRSTIEIKQGQSLDLIVSIFATLDQAIAHAYLGAKRCVDAAKITDIRFPNGEAVRYWPTCIYPQSVFDRDLRCYIGKREPCYV